MARLARRDAPRRPRDCLNFADHSDKGTMHRRFELTPPANNTGPILPRVHVEY